MRKLRPGRGRRWWVTAAALLAPLFCTGCTLVQPGCRNRDVKATIEREARESVELWMATSKLTPPSAETPILLADQVEVARHDNTRSCTAHVMVGGGNDAAAVPIEYEVIVGDDGQPFYRWDKDDFGKQYIGTALTSVLTNMAHAKAKTGTSDDLSITPAAPPPLEKQTGDAGAPASTLQEAWQKDVHAIIMARAEKLTEMPRGAQRIRFRVGGAGEVTNATAVGNVQNQYLADELIRFLEAMDALPAPPDHRMKWVEMTFSF